MILAIESSCDESALALLDPAKGFLGEWIHSQLALHSEYGGVVPALASREHLNNLPRLMESPLKVLSDGDARVDKIAVTYGPGLAGCLALGIAMARALSLAWGVPVVGVNHLRGHAFSPFIELFEADPEAFMAEYKALLPHLGMIVSGGNTIIFELCENGEITILAETIDDAAGEALDKGAKLLGMPYPGGALIEKKAKNGNREAFDFPRALGKSKDGRFSFSGLKTSLRYVLEKMSDNELSGNLNDLCASYQAAVMDQLCWKLEWFLSEKKYASAGLSGGVANNKVLRERFSEIARERQAKPFIAKPQHTGDNAGMIAFAAYIDPEGCFDAGSEKLSFDPALRL
ncbi:MAG: tRNA (adenosine(37)-N6)-threonylcarbamoyltransferase complex transferase subunit TsaD [Verrucomicrobia bacterium CG_4_10_14_3_um_filter_43_23]|nr:MAG: tRNA (adenosine(37)-N6)-threonylcarbamoyltransferase complex transferase subunit TsaD [Verrucomicrobia bacterium CG1_02_43_26]PIP59055.1 MAG: tRNA (adenosine(37)-N6)-threonylcarbamoyltransferase complex transferase subunit TsaD [Verrucomicrobia bacterium CG22_combo_CG10-13_8_21_14_all_43_17]PIX59152.1 MAG: tRNA (adenosine(37)-N6)-threonylcarbamoyltransferase complex transferase subunit TsaD [Verrucomicrobia bacterium CG_4_10_14_3_um_filter_43_23]PIY61325.1 MAG: tRNA (adenosine(37)-N6)-th